MAVNTTNFVREYKFEKESNSAPFFYIFFERHMKTAEQLINLCPKAELHVHIEGTFEPELFFTIAQRNGISIPYDSPEHMRSLQVYNNLQEFLDAYIFNAQVLRNEQDFYDMTMAYFAKARQNNIVHAEIFFDLQFHLHGGIKPEVVLEGLTAAIKQAHTYNMSAQLILCFIRNFSQDQAFEMLQRAAPYQEYISAVGLAATELGNPPSKFKDVFAKARAQGYKAVAHAGEVAPVDYIWQAVTDLKVSRIDHGNAIVNDQKLIEYVSDNAIALTMCPLSNMVLHVVKTLDNYPIRRLLESNVLVTINSDDPSYFGGYVNDNLLALVRALQLTNQEVVALLKNSFTASFLPSEQQAHYIQLIDQIAKVD